MVECQLPKLKVASSSLVTRSISKADMLQKEHGEKEGAGIIGA
jgi:hypothetical protein